MNGKAIRFDIEPKWSKTTANFEKQAKGLGINDQKLKQEIIFYLSEQWLKLLENGNGHTTTGEQHNGNNNGLAASAVIREDAAQIALGLVEEQCSELFLDQFGSPYAAVRIGEHTETLPLKSSRFKNWLCRTFYKFEQDVLNNENVTNVLNILKARAEFDGIQGICIYVLQVVVFQQKHIQFSAI